MRHQFWRREARIPGIEVEEAHGKPGGQEPLRVLLSHQTSAPARTGAADSARRPDDMRDILLQKQPPIRAAKGRSTGRHSRQEEEIRVSNAPDVERRLLYRPRALYRGDGLIGEPAGLKELVD